MKQFSYLLVLLLWVTNVVSYSVSQIYSGPGLYDGNLWDFFTGSDPTHGAVEYVNRATAMSNGLLSHQTLGTNYYATTFRSKKGSSNSRRQSVRVISKRKWSRGLFVMELKHMPEGCSTWPAFWLLSNNGVNWPTGGEIDILEGVNTQTSNHATLHTINGCSQSALNGRGGHDFRGSWTKGTGNNNATNCFINAPNQFGNQGCQIDFRNGQSYGKGLNQAGGGTFALEVTDSFIRVFFFPAGQYQWQSNPNPDTWGKPYALFRFGSNCPSSMFYDLNIIINLTFCGDWAGEANTWNGQCGSTGHSTCASYLAANHAKLDAEAFWTINSITVYTK